MSLTTFLTNTNPKWSREYNNAEEKTSFHCSNHIRWFRGLDKREMFGDQTPSNIVWRANILPFGHLVWCCLIVFCSFEQPRLKHVWCGNAHHACSAACINCLICVWSNMFNRWPLTSTLACLVTKQCLILYGRQTFFICPGPQTLVWPVANHSSAWPWTPYRCTTNNIALLLRKNTTFYNELYKLSQTADMTRTSLFLQRALKSPLFWFTILLHVPK